MPIKRSHVSHLPELVDDVGQGGECPLCHFPESASIAHVWVNAEGVEREFSNGPYMHCTECCTWEFIVDWEN